MRLPPSIRRLPFAEVDGRILFQFFMLPWSGESTAAAAAHAELIPMNFGIGPSTDFVDQSRLPHMSDRIIITNVNII